MATPDHDCATIEEMIEQLYDLDRKELRRLAYEALLISDGPDHIEGDVEYAPIHARYFPPNDSPFGHAFVVRPREDNKDS